MNEKNHGLIIEGFVQGSYNRMFDNKIEVRHHPLTGWAQATVSGSESNFAATKDNVLRTFEGVTHTLYTAGNNDDLLNELSEFKARAEESESIVDLGIAIDEARPVLDRAFARPVPSEQENE
ncbi:MULTISPECIES: hypothetical protein [Pseudomonas]|jgi:hypothetical protein|uniref:hypothetical protein n=1 Tax=Pseudomonas TaxID=286 RepID=UPI000D392ADE|nr:MULTISPECIES: hypothetical protein [Pseudomonas]NWC59487.1 hypothetical protein [Pseudomonas veronii]PUB37856.1 hypothetical protein C8K66_101563 [Pseudomonas sp. GV105]